MELTSPTLFTLTVAGAVVCTLLAALPLLGLRRRTSTDRPRAWRLALGYVGRLAVVLLAQVLTISAVLLGVNNAFGLYVDWSELTGPTGEPAAQLVQTNPLPAREITPMKVSPRNPHPGGKMMALTVPGADAPYNTVQVWLPPQYFERSQRDTHFPVLVAMNALHGTGAALASQVQGPARSVRAIAQGKASPFIVVWASSRVTAAVDSECVDLPNGVKGQSWFSDTLVKTVGQHFRTVAPGRGWFVAGYSTGGQCAAVLVARHPHVFTAGVNIAGYFTPMFDDPSVVASQPQLVAQNSPLAMVRAHQLKRFPVLSVMSRQDRQSWGTGSGPISPENADGSQFEALARSVPGAAFLLLESGGHSRDPYYALWDEYLEWLGQQGL